MHLLSGLISRSSLHHISAKAITCMWLVSGHKDVLWERLRLLERGPVISPWKVMDAPKNGGLQRTPDKHPANTPGWTSSSPRLSQVSGQEGIVFINCRTRRSRSAARGPPRAWPFSRSAIVLLCQVDNYLLCQCLLTHFHTRRGNKRAPRWPRLRFWPNTGTSLYLFSCLLLFFYFFNHPSLLTSVPVTAQLSLCSSATL